MRGLDSSRLMKQVRALLVYYRAPMGGSWLEIALFHEIGLVRHMSCGRQSRANFCPNWVTRI